ncbi:uncharacterized protein [Typha latifolia]|uniref:uncharacterized protein n=1 Tax=Typha latifolia TaxID=4733 RepID=UPI003C2F2640
MEKGLISIDRWSEESQAYFLTHLHADHTKGLSSKWSKGPLFCSPISARLFPPRFRGFDLSLLRVLEVGATHPISLVSPTTGSEVRFLVTPIDAHHCPGAVMYLFRGEFGCVLYTGDFRWESMSERSGMGRKTLLDALQGDKLDVLYLDNTYCHPSYSFPPREVVARQVVEIISSHPDHEIIIAVDTLGKEDLLLHISKALGTKIWVWPERLQTMHLLGYYNIFTTKTSLTRIRAVPRYSFTFETLEALNTVHPTIGIMPSGLPWGMDIKYRESSNRRARQCNNQTEQPQMLHQYAYSVPYSEHSCFSEIQEFMKIVQPSVVTGIVSSSICYVNPRHYFSNICGARLDKACNNFYVEKAENKKNRSFLKWTSSRSLKVKKEGKFKIANLILRRSKIAVIRKERRGVKIEETDGLCTSDLDVNQKGSSR